MNAKAALFLLTIFSTLGQTLAQQAAPKLSVGMVANASDPPLQDHPDLSLERAQVPFYPPIARAARVSGTVELRVQVNDGIVTDVDKTSGPAILAAAAAANVKTWHFHRWVHANFTTKFVYRIETKEPLIVDPRVELDLPVQVVITTVPPLLDTGKK